MEYDLVLNKIWEMTHWCGGNIVLVFKTLTSSDKVIRKFIHVDL